VIHSAVLRVQVAAVSSGISCERFCTRKRVAGKARIAGPLRMTGSGAKACKLTVVANRQQHAAVQRGQGLVGGQAGVGVALALCGTLPVFKKPAAWLASTAMPTSSNAMSMC
jgi:hypothetical protein